MQGTVEEQVHHGGGLSWYKCSVFLSELRELLIRCVRFLLLWLLVQVLIMGIGIGCISYQVCYFLVIVASYCAFLVRVLLVLVLL